MQNSERVKLALQGTTKFKAIDTERLSKKVGICPQAIRGAVNQLRSIGIPIVVGQNGYYIEKDRQSVARYADTLELKAKGVLRACKGLRRYAKLGLKK